MKIYGIDFTSRPSRKKPLTCLECNLEGDVLRAEALIEWSRFEAFEAALIRPGPWIAGIDFPFGLPRKFIENIGWPLKWADYVEYVRTPGRTGFRDTLDAYPSSRPAGDKEHRRATDIAAGSISPQKIYGTPVGLMFFEGAPRLRDSGVTIPGLLAGDPERLVVETYPGIIKTVPYAPLSHPFVERLIGTIRREFLDQVLFWNASDLERKLANFRQYYNSYRVHTALDGDTPSAFPCETTSHCAALSNFHWKSHCRGLYQLPVAA